MIIIIICDDTEVGKILIIALQILVTTS